MSETPARDRGPAKGRNGRAPDVVLDWLEAQLEAGALRAGDRLPAERDLAAQLDVSRTAVREAIRILEALGILTQGTGSGREAGTILVPSPAEALTRFLRMHVLLASIGPDDVVHARIALERESARLAALHATPADLAAMAGHLAEMDRPDVSAEAYGDADTAFHVALAQASGNPLVCEMTIALRTAMRPMLLQGLRASHVPEETMRRLVGEHRAILAAVRAGDPSAADRVEAHIAGFYGQDRGGGPGG